MSIWVCGEVLIDLLPGTPNRLAIVGGGPANTAKALSRLGHNVQFIDGISTDKYGQSARAELIRDGVGLDLALTSDLPTCTATVSLSDDGSATYEFLIDGTATFAFDNSWLPDPERLKPEVLQIGTLVTIIEPGASVLYDWAVKVGEFAPIVFDPNIRPSVMPDLVKYRDEVEKWIKISSVVKFSEDDIAALYPNEDPIEIAKICLEKGVQLVVITRGANGVVGVTADGVVDVPGIKVTVVDTVGAGDTVGAIIVEAVVQRGILNLTGSNLKEVLHRAAVAAAITCSRAGAQPPRAFELTEALERN
ncbi:RbsK Sugar kinases, ribokinase family [Candidatus Nanopelagicaceae bacterium]